MTFSEKLVLLRKNGRMTQEALAKAVGVTRQSVYMWEKGQSYPEAGKLLELRRLFHVSIDALLDDSIPLSGRYSAVINDETPCPVSAPRSGQASEPDPDFGKSDGSNAEPPKKPDPERYPAPPEIKQALSKQPVRARVEEPARKRTGSILDLLGSFWRKKK